MEEVDVEERRRQDRQRTKNRVLECIFESRVNGMNNFTAARRLYQDRYRQHYCPSRHTFRK